MEINGKTVTEEDMKSMLHLQYTGTPESEAAYEEAEKKRLKEEACQRVLNSNENAGIPKRFWKSMFWNYPSELAEKAKKLCMQENSDTVYILSGSTGRGKTTLLCSAIHERAYQGVGGSYYYNIRNLEIHLRKYRNFNSDEDELIFIKRLSEYPFLCIDEVGTCENKIDEMNFLAEVICARYDNYLPTWIATNLTPIQFKAFICNVDLTGKTTEEIKEISERLDKENVVLNRIKSVAVIDVLKGESYRGVHNGDSSETK